MRQSTDHIAAVLQSPKVLNGSSSLPRMAMKTRIMEDKAQPLALATIGALLKEWRKKQGYTQSKVADRIGVSAAYISMIEAGKKDCMLYIILDYLAAIDVVPEIILKSKK